MTKPRSRAASKPSRPTQKASRTLTFSEYQVRALDTSQLQLGGPQGVIPPLLGLASETGSILDSYKRFLRDKIDAKANREFLREELGDLLWYVSVVASAADLELEDVAANNLVRARDLYAPGPAPDLLRKLRLPDEHYPVDERFPRILVVSFEEHERDGQPRATQTVVGASPNAFPDGPVMKGSKPQGFRIGAPLGADLTDNTRRTDAYRYHDALHMGFMAVLGWSPTMRGLLKLKRRSRPDVDEREDGARATFAEEGLAAILSRLAIRRMGLLGENSVDGPVIEMAKAAAHDLEIQSVPGWLWRRAISNGFRAMHELEINKGGYLRASLKDRELTYTKLSPPLELGDD